MTTRDEQEAEVDQWTEGTCRECGLLFPLRGGFERFCPFCYKVSRDYKVLWGDQAFLWAQKKVQHLEQELMREKLKASQAPAPPVLKGSLLKDLIVLCHPDKHANNPRATRVTKHLLALRGMRKKKP